MFARLIHALFTPKYPKGYTGRHRASFVPVRKTTTALAATSMTISHEATA